MARPSDCDTATVRGAAQYGLARRPLVSSVIAPQSYMMKVRFLNPRNRRPVPSFNFRQLPVFTLEWRWRYNVKSGLVADEYFSPGAR